MKRRTWDEVRAALATGEDTVVLREVGTFRRVGTQVFFEPAKRLRSLLIAVATEPTELPEPVAALVPHGPHLRQWNATIAGVGRFTFTRAEDALRGGLRLITAFRCDQALARARTTEVDSRPLLRALAAGLPVDLGIGRVEEGMAGIRLRPAGAWTVATKRGEPHEVPKWARPIAEGLVAGDVHLPGFGWIRWRIDGTIRGELDADLVERLGGDERWRDGLRLERAFATRGDAPGEDLVAAATDPRWDRLERIVLRGANDGDARFLASRDPRHIPVIDLRDGRITDAGARALAAVEWPGLERLDLSGNLLSADGVAALDGLPVRIGLQRADVHFVDAPEEWTLEGVLPLVESWCARILTAIGADLPTPAEVEDPSGYEPGSTVLTRLPGLHDALAAIDHPEQDAVSAAFDQAVAWFRHGGDVDWLEDLAVLLAAL